MIELPPILVFFSEHLNKFTAVRKSDEIRKNMITVSYYKRDRGVYITYQLYDKGPAPYSDKG